MEHSIFTYIAGGLGLLIFVKWMFKPESQHPSLQNAQQNAEGSTNTNARINNRSDSNVNERRLHRRAVTQDMIEVVQSIGPHLTVEQIRFDLEKTGNVEDTVDTFLRTGTLPAPPPSRSHNSSSSSSSSSSSNNTGFSRPATSSRVSTNSSSSSGTPVNLKEKCHFNPENLITKYNVDVTHDYSETDYKSLSLDDKKKYMIWKARKGYVESMQ